jgi:hypothetical protein
LEKATNATPHYKVKKVVFIYFLGCKAVDYGKATFSHEQQKLSCDLLPLEMSQDVLLNETTLWVHHLSNDVWQSLVGGPPKTTCTACTTESSLSPFAVRINFP